MATRAITVVVYRYLSMVCPNSARDGGMTGNLSYGFFFFAPYTGHNYRVLPPIPHVRSL